MNSKRPAFPARIDLTSGAPTPARTGLPPLRRAATPSPAKTPEKPRTKPAQPPHVATHVPKAQASAPAQQAGTDSFQQFRRRMVEWLAHEHGIRDAAVLQAMATVERHHFVDTALRGQAYEDTSLPIGLNQTISKPSVVARMIELLRQGLPAAPGYAPGSAGNAGRHPGRVLEIGTGCGYQAAVLGQVAREVYSMERLRGLHDKARDNLRPFRLANVHLLLGDGMLGYPQGAPYAGIIAAAGGESIPQAWIDQLAVGGRLVAPVAVDATPASPSGSQALLVVDKTPTGLKQTLLEPVLFVPLKSGIS